MKQRFLTLLLTALLMPIGAWAALAVGDTFVVNGMTFQVTSLSPNEVQVGKNGKCAIDVNTEGAVSIPSSVKDSDGKSYSVTAIGSSAFNKCINLSSINIPSSVTHIGGSAFWGCTALAETHVADIKAWCGINFVNQDSNPLYLSKHLYMNGHEVKDLVIPEGVTKISDQAFIGCSGLTSVSIPSGVTNFGEAAFAYCEGLTSVTSASNLGHWTFLRSWSITNITLLEGVTNLSSEDIYLDGIDTNNILTRITIPASMKSFKDGWSSFNSLTEIHIKDLASWCNIEFGSNPLSKAGHLFMDEKEVKDLVIPEGVTSISDKAFKGCVGMNSISIPKSMEKIGSDVMYNSGVFVNCTNLTAVHINDVAAWCKIDFASNYSNPLSFAKHLFKDGNEIKDLIIPEGTSNINKYVFYGWEGLNSVSIPKSLKSIGKEAFKGCTNLTAVHINDVAAWCAVTFNSFWDNPLQIAGHLFMNGQEVKDLVIPEGVTNINKWVFLGCKDLNSVSIPKSLISIGEYAFSMVNALYISDLTAWCRVKCNGDDRGISCRHLFLNEEEITNLIIPDEVTSINQFLFSNFDGLTSVNTGNTLKEIGSYAFSHCDNLVSVTLGSTVESICYRAFFGCKEIQSVYSYIEEPYYIGNYVFCYRDDATQEDVPLSSATLYVPIGTKAKYEATEGWNNFKEIVEMSILDPIDGETTVNTEGLGGQDLTDNVVDDVYYNLDGSNSGYDSTDGSIVIGETTNMGQITNPMPGTSDVTNNFTGLILRVAAGKGTITVNVKTIGNAQLVVQVGNSTPMIATKTEQGDVVINYDVAEDTYIYIYAIIGSSGAPSLRAASDNVVKIYGIKVTPGSTGINTVCSSEPIVNGYYTLDGRKIEGMPTKKGLYIVNGHKVVVK